MAIVDVQKFGKYEILEELGRGGMGVVYKARDPIIGRLVALKTLTPGSAADPDLLKRFYREAQAAGRLQHPNIITIFDMGEVEGTPYIAMSFLEGETLEKMIAGREPLSVAQKLGIILQVCRGLDFAHKHGVVHRDIKPANVFLGKDGTVRVLDFGIVHIATTTMTKSGMVIGTVPYMSPEQVTGQPVDQRSDVFSVGTLSYEFLTYAKPFDGPNLPAIMYKIVHERPALPCTLASDIPPALEHAVMRCLEPRPENRFQSLEDFVLELEPLAQSLKRQMVGNLIGQGQELYQRKEYSKAKEVLRDVLMLDSSHGLAQELMAKVNAELWQAEVAARVERLVEDGSRLLKQGSPTEAVRVLEEALNLDTANGQARFLLSEAQQTIEREKLLRQGLAAVNFALGRGNLTVAEAELGKVLQLDAGSHEAEVLQGKIKQARAHERRLRIQQAVLFPQHLLGEERYEEAIQQLDQLAREFPGEAEIEDLLRTAQIKYREQAKRRQIEAQVGLAKRLIGDRRFQEAIDLIERLRTETQGPELALLRESARQGLELAVREQRQHEITSLLHSGDIDRAFQEADRALDQFPGDADLTALWTTAEREIKARTKNQQRGVGERRQAAETRYQGLDSATDVVRADALQELLEKPLPSTRRVPPAASVAPAPSDLSPLPVVPFWKRRIFQGAAAGVAALLLIAVLIWRALDKAPGPLHNNPAGPSHNGPTEEQLALEKEAQDYEGQHRLLNALNIWEKLQAESGPLQKDAAEAVRRVQERTDQAESLFEEGKRAERLSTRQGYEAAKSDYSQAGQINADLKPRTDQAIQGIDLLIAGKTPAQIEQQNYSKAQQLLKKHEYPEAKAALTAIVEQNLPSSRLAKRAQIQLGQIDGLIQDQQKYDDAEHAFNAQQYDKAQSEFQDLVNGNTEWKAEAQMYLRQIQELQTAAKQAAAQQAAAQQAAANNAIKAAEEKVQEKVAAKRYGEASRLLADVESAGANSDSLRKVIEDAYHGELNSYKLQAASNPTDAGLKSVLVEVQDLVQRAGPLNKDATDYALSLQNQIDRLNQPPAVNPPPAPAPPPTLTPTIIPVVPMEQAWKDLIKEEMIVPAKFVRGGLHFAFKPSLPDAINARAHKGDEVDLNCTVSADGEVKSCSPTAKTDFANLVAAAARSWKFQGPILLDQSNAGADKRVNVRVPIAVSY
jgi:hypothetical protein